MIIFTILHGKNKHYGKQLTDCLLLSLKKRDIKYFKCNIILQVTFYSLHHLEIFISLEIFMLHCPSNTFLLLRFSNLLLFETFSFQDK